MLMELGNYSNAFKKLLKLETFGYVYVSLERRYPDEFGRRVYRKNNSVSENKNENVEITVRDTDILRKQILTKFDRF
jgi:hypothetical protein